MKDIVLRRPFTGEEHAAVLYEFDGENVIIAPDPAAPCGLAVGVRWGERWGLFDRWAKLSHDHPVTISVLARYVAEREESKP